MNTFAKFSIAATALVLSSAFAPAFAAALPMAISGDTVLSGPCVQANTFKRADRIVFRAHVVDTATGADLDASGLQSVVAVLPDGSKFDLAFGDHPPENATAHFWSVGWTVPADYPTGTLSYQIVATNKAGDSVTFEPFKVFPSQLTITE
jgi:hypothetical protein